MMMTQKYNAKPVFYCCQSNKIFENRQANSNLFFASTFEFEVYQALRQIIPPGLIHVQVPILIKHASKRYPAIFWKCDFRVYKNRSTKTEYLNIEAKGVAMPEFKRALKYMDWFSQNDYSRLLVVTTSKTRKIDPYIQGCSITTMTKTLVKQGYGSI